MEMNEMCNVYETLSKTSESQGHGKSIERSIQSKVFDLTETETDKINHTEIHDIPKEYNNVDMEGLQGKHISIKTTTSNSIDCGDFERFINHTSPDSNTVMIVSKLKQEDLKHKRVIGTSLVDVSQVSSLFINENYCQFKEDVKEYVHYIKSLPHGKIDNGGYLAKKKELVKTYPEISKAIKIHPKIDREKQRRVQCSMTLRFLKENNLIIDEWNGAMVYCKGYDEKILSPPRKRNGLTIRKIKEYCKGHNINGPGKRGGWASLKKEEMINYLEEFGVSESEMISYCESI